MTMTLMLSEINLHVMLTEDGDALIWGEEYGNPTPAERLGRLLFAHHEASLYGTQLQMQSAGSLSVIVLPAEMSLAFIADPPSNALVSWTVSNPAVAALQHAVWLLHTEALAGRYKPSFAAYRQGRLLWEWENSKELADIDWDLIAESCCASGTLDDLRRTFSAFIFAHHYDSDTALSDLHREYPALFSSEGHLHPVAPGISEVEWLDSLGWQEDPAGFRPLIQLQEPDESDSGWMLRLLLQDKADPAHLLPMSWDFDSPSAATWPSAWSAHLGSRVAGWQTRLEAWFPADDDRCERRLNDQQAFRFLSSDSVQLLRDHWVVILPSWWETAAKRKPRLRARVQEESMDAAGQRRSAIGLRSILRFDWRVSIGGADLSESEFLALLNSKERLIRFQNEWILLDPQLLEEIRQFMSRLRPEEGLSLQDVMQLHLQQQWRSAKKSEPSKSEEDEDGPLTVEMGDTLQLLFRQLAQPAEHLPLLPDPPDLQANLRSYQQQGFTWLCHLRRFGFGACLADDMGLGKTIQFIAYLLHHKQSAQSPALLICPTSVLGNWQKELARFAPSLRLRVHYGRSRMNAEELASVCSESDIILTSYTTALLDQSTLQSVTWSCLCLDEAQNIKNAQTKQSQAIRSLHAEHRIAMTGTPIENRLSELWSIYDFINPGYLGQLHGFQLRFANPIERDQDQERTEQLQLLVQPFMLRRKKNDPTINLDLPEKQETKVYLHLSAEQGALYEHTVKQLMDQLKTMEGMERRGAILSALTKLKQLCDHPALLTKEDWAEPIQFQDGTWRENFAARSAKLDRLLAMVDELREGGESCLIFTQYIGMGNMIKAIVEAHRGEPTLYLNGSTPKATRDKMIDQFQRADASDPAIFILSLKAGGVGLNLTAASHVFHFDRWWNPAVENQATDRAYRMGQVRNVQVHKYISLGTLEERIDDMLESKMALSENIIAVSDNWITELSDHELADLLGYQQR